MLRKVVKYCDELSEMRQKIIQDYDMLVNSGADPKSVLKVIGVSRATMYRWKKKHRGCGYKVLIPVSRSLVTKRKPTWHRTIKYKFYRLYEGEACVHEVNKELAKYL